MHRSDYELLDFGDGEKLERFGDYLVRRPNLYARGKRKSSQHWDDVHLRFRAGQGSATKGQWSSFLPGNSGNVLDSSWSEWSVKIDGAVFNLKPTPVGHLGVFPEQQANWDWLKRNVQPLAQLARNQSAETPLRALNLFAYTGGSTMALAQCGVSVVHLDGAANTVKWARRNAELSDVNQGVRWIAEDALRFVHREIKRENHYDILVADPPSFGRGPKKEQWRIARDMPLLFDAIVQLMPNPVAVICSCHSEGFDRFEMAEMLQERFHRYPQYPSGRFEQLKLQLNTPEGRKLDAGECVRWLSDRTEA